MTRNLTAALLLSALAAPAFAQDAGAARPAEERQGAREARRQQEGGDRQRQGGRQGLYQNAIEKVKPAIVQIKYVSEGGGMMGGGEEEQQTDGVLVSGDGLVLLANSSFGGLASMFGGGGNPKDIRVFVGDETEGRKASVLARDTERDLTWIKLDEAPEEELPHLAIDGSASAEVGDRIVQVTRASEFYGHAAKVSEGIVTGTTTRPRELMFASELLQNIGMPVLNNAEIIGFLVLQLPSMDEIQSAGGFGAGFQPELCILPIEEVRQATENARAMEETEE